MPCQRPLKGFPVGLTPDGKTKYKIVPFATKLLELVDNKWTPSESEPIIPGTPVKREWIPIPCGKCFACRMRQRREWTCRLLLESRKYKDDQMWFLTMTYDDEHLPFVLGANSLGEAQYFASLKARDLTLFWKRLRSKFKQPLRYFACGEYSPSGRPHYHAIVFGLDLRNCKVRSCRKGKSGMPVYEIEEISQLWHEEETEHETDQRYPELGFVVCGKVTPKSCAYVAGYVLKKSMLSNKQDFTNREPEFTRMSRRPGIGSGYHPDGIVLTLGDQTYGLPRYFRKQDDSFDEELSMLAQLSQRQLCRAVHATDLSDSRSARRYLAYLAGEEETQKKKNAFAIQRNEI